MARSGNWAGACVVLAICYSASPACATGARVLSFEASKTHPFVITSAPPAKEPDAGRALRSTERVPRLEADFAEQGEAFAALHTPIERTSNILVPAWMRSAAGHAGMGNLPASPFSTFAPRRALTPCDDATYRPNHHISLEAEGRRAAFYRTMAQAACDAGIPVVLFDALITQESRYNPAALSPKGAIGMSQLMPARARALGVSNAWSIEENLRGGARHMRALLDEFGRFDLALAAYNAGEGRVRGKGQVPHIRETVDYVRTILKTVEDLQLGDRG